MHIRTATLADADVAAEVVRRSITHLCAPDYRNDPAVLARWLKDRSGEDMRRLIRAPDVAVFVVVTEDGGVIGVGTAAHAGTIELNHVAPEARFCGVSKLLVRHMEAYLIGLGNRSITLLSSSVAREFYLALGYAEGGQEESRFGTLPGTRMVKRLPGE